MAENRKISPKGIDIPIDRLQHLIYLGLQSNGWTNHESYCRAYKNETENGQTPEFALDGKDYKEVLYNDNFSATSFFLTEDNLDHSEVYDTTVSIIFQVNLVDIFTSITTHRADEEMHRLVALILEDNKWDYKLSSIVTSLNDVYAGLDSFDLDQVRTDDMSDFHVVRFDIDINFNYQCDSNYTPPTCRVGTVTDSDGVSTFTVASGESGACTVVPAASGIAYLNAQPPQQYISYRTGDAAWNNQNGIYDLGVRPTLPIYTQELDLTVVTNQIGYFLKYDNAFGNKARYTLNDGTALVTFNDLTVRPYIIDHLYNLGWSSDSLTVNWEQAIDSSLTHSVTVGADTYSDFFLPSANDIRSLVSNQNNNVWKALPFKLSSLGNYLNHNFWSSETYLALTTYAFRTVGNGGTSATRAKTDATQYGFYCRKHY